MTADPDATSRRRKLIIDLLPSLIAAATAIVTAFISVEVARYNINSAFENKRIEMQGGLANKSLEILAANANSKDEAVERARKILSTFTGDPPNNVEDCVRRVTAYFIAPKLSPPPPAKVRTDADLMDWILDVFNAVEENRDAYILAMTLLRGCHLPTPDYSKH